MIIRQSNFITIKPIILRLNFVRVKKIDTCKQRNSVWGCLDECGWTLVILQSSCFSRPWIGDGKSSGFLLFLQQLRHRSETLHTYRQFLLKTPNSNMITNLNLISRNFFSPSLPLTISNLTITHQTQTQTRNPQKLRSPTIIPFNFSPNFNIRANSNSSKMGLLQKWRTASGSQTAGDPVEKASPTESERGSSGNGNGGEGRDWTTSILLFVLWAGLLFYVFNLAPNQTPVFTWFSSSFLFFFSCTWFIKYLILYVPLKFAVNGLVFLEEAFELEKWRWFQNEWSSCLSLVSYGLVAPCLRHAAAPFW